MLLILFKEIVNQFLSGQADREQIKYIFFSVIPLTLREAFICTGFSFLFFFALSKHCKWQFFVISCLLNYDQFSNLEAISKFQRPFFKVTEIMCNIVHAISILLYFLCSLFVPNLFLIH